MSKSLKVVLLILTIVVGTLVARVRANKDLRERSFVITGALSKEKAYDGVRHEFILAVSLSISSSDLFRFDEVRPQLAEAFYKTVLDHHAKVGPAEVNNLQEAFGTLIAEKGIEVRDISLDLKQK
jgi:hypothetical protein